MAKILLTGATGYIGRRLLPVLLNDGHQVVCLVRDKRRFDFDSLSNETAQNLEIIECDLEKPATLEKLPLAIDAAYYMVHSLDTKDKGFGALENKTAENFIHYVEKSKARQIVYLSGIANDQDLSEHLSSRKNVEMILGSRDVPLTVLRAAIIIGSGGASFEIIRDLVEKLPVMIAPKWLHTKCQPIAIRNVLEYLLQVLLNPATFGKAFDIGGPDILSYKEMLLGYARVRGLRRWIISVPVLSPRLSSLWLYFVTSTSYMLARNLVDSMKNEVVCQNTSIQDIAPIELISYKEALQLAFVKINQNEIISSWKDALYNKRFDQNFLNHSEVPVHGCLTDKRQYPFQRDPVSVTQNIWEIGGDRGWYYGNFLWKIRGYLDKLVGGVGLRRGRRSPVDLKPGDALDFWRVLIADKSNKRLLLYAEMKLPGEAWLEFCIKKKGDHHVLFQNATFRPLGLWGRIYWYAVLPFHGFIFRGMAKRIIEYNSP